MTLEPIKSPSQRMAFSAIVVIAANTMNGPGLTTLPAVGESAGLVMFVILTTLSMGITSFVIYSLSKLIWTHQKLDHQIDGPDLKDSDIVALSKEAWKSDAAKRISSIAMVGCALALALAQMMLCAKIADAMIVASFGSACGISPLPTSSDSQFLHCTSNMSMKPFTPSLSTETTKTTTTTTKTIIDGITMTTSTTAAEKEQSPPMFLLTAGLVIASSITISLASVDQSSMITAQYVLFGCLLLACMRFCYTLSQMSTTPMEEQNIGASNTNDQKNVSEECHDTPEFVLGNYPFEAVGSILFNFAFVVTAPPLVCDAYSMNDAIRALIVAIVIMGVLYSIIGWIGAYAAACSAAADDDGDGNGGDTNLLSLVLRDRGHWDILSVIVFGLSQLAAIPVYCELARETMDSHIKVLSSTSSFWMCHAAPWVICAITYNSELFESFVEWSSLLLLGFANFSLPLLLDLKLRDHHPHSSVDSYQIGQGPDIVLWMYSLVSGGIASVIVQRMTESLMLAEIIFMATVLTIFHYYH